MGNHVDVTSTTIEWGRGGSAALLAGSLALVAVVAFAGSQAGSSDSDWYRELEKAPWNPPGWVFGSAWSVLYLLMGVGAWLVAREGLERSDVRRALGLYVVQLAFNLAWTWIFFGEQRPGWALVEIVVLLALVILTALAFAAISRLAGWLLVPYAAWVVFALSLTLWIVLAN